MNVVGTYHGQLIDPMRVKPDQVNIFEIAYQLSRINRFNGATIGEPYSVAEHCIHVSHAVDQCDPHLMLAALMHDVEEYLTGDIIRPFKQSYKNINENTQTMRLQIAKALGYNPTYRFNDIKEADDRVLRIEMKNLTMFPDQAPEGLPEFDNNEAVGKILDARITIEKVMTWERARDNFLIRYQYLRNLVVKKEKLQAELDFDIGAKDI